MGTASRCCHAGLGRPQEPAPCRCAAARVSELSVALLIVMGGAPGRLVTVAYLLRASVFWPGGGLGARICGQLRIGDLPGGSRRSSRGRTPRDGVPSGLSEFRGHSRVLSDGGDSRAAAREPTVHFLAVSNVLNYCSIKRIGGRAEVSSLNQLEPAG